MLHDKTVLLVLVLFFLLVSSRAFAYETNQFPELFKYDNTKNQNLLTALSDISTEFNKNDVQVTPELLVAIAATLKQEVGGSFLPVEEGGDFGMGENCTYKVGGKCRSTPYNGGVDYKGRGYIQITHKYNYQTYCGADCIGNSTPEQDICGCKNQFYCTVQDEVICPQIRALRPDYASRIFVQYYIGHGTVSLAQDQKYWQVGATINGGDYPNQFKSKADAYLALFTNESNVNKTNELLKYLNSKAVISVPGSTSGSIWNKGTWEATMDVPQGTKQLRVNLDWSTTDSLYLILEGPEYSVMILNPRNDDGLLNVSAGRWNVSVYGNSVQSSPSKTVDFTVTTALVPLDSLEPPGGVNFTSIRLNYLSTCAAADQGLAFTIQGKEAGPNDVILNTSVESKKATNDFMAGLIVPNHAQFVTLDLVPDGNGWYKGSVDRLDPTFRKTETAKTLLEADVKLKFDQFGSTPRQNLMPQMQQYWVDLVKQSPYWNEIEAAGFSEFPRWLQRTWIHPKDFQVNGSGCNIFVTKTELDVDFVFDSITLDAGKYNFRQEISNDLNNRLQLWKQKFLERQDSEVTKPTEQLVNNDPKYAGVRQVYASLAMAQWYKKQDRSQIPLGELIDSNNITEYEISFDKAYWEGQALQFLYEKEGSPCGFHGETCKWTQHGGVTFGEIPPDVLGNLSKQIDGLMQDAITKDAVQIGNEHYWGSAFRTKDADLAITALYLPSQELETNRTVDINMIVKNYGASSAGAFKIFVYDKFTSTRNYTAIYPIGEIPVLTLENGTSGQFSIEWNTKQLWGSHEIFAEADYSNTVKEGNEFNNEKSVNVFVTTLYPEATILSPVHSSSFVFADSVTFVGTGSDLQDGQLTGNTLKWISSIDGEIGTGETFVLSNLSHGAHIITFVATDYSGHSDSKQIGMAILPAKPVLTIHNPPDGSVFNLGDNVSLDALATDAEDGDLSSQIIWTSSKNGNLGQGSVLTVNNLAIGSHILTATITDSTGSTDSKEARVIIVAPQAVLLTELSDNSKVKELGFSGSGEQTIFLSFPKNVKVQVLLANLDIEGKNVTPNAITNPGFDTNSKDWGSSWFSTWPAETYGGGKCPWAHDYGCWGWQFQSAAKNGSWTILYQNNVDLTDVDAISFQYMEGGHGFGDPDFRITESFYIDDNLIWKCTPPSKPAVTQWPGSPCYDQPTTITLNLNGYEGQHQIKFRGDVETPPGFISIPEGTWVVFKVDNVTAYRETSYPANPAMDVSDDGINEWSYADKFKTKETTSDFSQSLQNYIDNTCTQDPCLVPIQFKSDSSGILKLSNIHVQYLIVDTEPPAITGSLSPIEIFSGDTLLINATATDNKQITSVEAWQEGNFIPTSCTGLAGTLAECTAIFNELLVPGEYSVRLKAVDSSDITSEIRLPFIVKSRNPDLTGSFALQQIATEREDVSAFVVVKNLGDQPANNFAVSLYADGLLVAKDSLTLGALANASVVLKWNAIYGKHTLQVKVDSDNVIPEEDESNNDPLPLNITVIDITGPPAPQPVAQPVGWTNLKQIKISFDPVSDANGIDRYEYQIDFGTWASIGLNTSFVTDPQSDGMHIVTVRAVDKPGNFGDFGFVNILIDTTSPNAPHVREWHTGTNWTVHNTPYYTWTNPGDFGSGITYYIGSLDGTDINLSSENYHPSLSSGEHSFKLKALDALAQESLWSNEIQILVDVDPPGFPSIDSISHPNPEEFYAVNMPVLNFNAFDAHSGAQGYYYLVDQEPTTLPDTNSLWTTESEVNLTTMNTVIFNETPILGLSDGTWYFHILARDAVGNLGNASHRKIKIDTSAPTTTDNASPDWVAAVEVALNAQDTLSGVAATMASLDGDAFTERNQVFFNGTSGEHTVSYYSIDTVGNVEQTKTTKVKVDTDAPAIGIVSPEARVYSPSEILVLNFSANDAHSGVSSVTAEFDGQLVSNGDTLNLANFTGEHTLTVTAIDHVSNVRVKSVRFMTLLRGLVLVGEDQLKITPETLRVNPGILTVHINFPVPFEDGIVLNATADGAPMDSVADGTNIKFRRDVLENYLQTQNQTLDVYFNIEGWFRSNGRDYLFRGSDAITKINKK